MVDVRKIVKEMTLEEKANFCSGHDRWYTESLERLGVPAIMMADGPHGLRKQVASEKALRGYEGAVAATCYPTAAGVACSWNTELVRQMGEALGEEAKGEGVSILLGPGVNIKRSPLCGRNFEYYSEDPYLAGKIAASYINGVQSKGVGTSIKHFAANNQEHRRHCTSAVVDMRTLREIYLTAFEIAVKESKPATIMHSYNRINGEQVSKSKWLLNDILRDEWGYDGVVISDWNAINDRVASLEAGSDLEMPGTYGVRDRLIVKAVEEGRLNEAVLDRTVERILKMIYKYLPDKNAQKVDLKKMSDFSAKVGEESMVLLKNEKNVLPLDPKKPLAVIGAFAESPRCQGRGSSHVNAPYVDDLLALIMDKNDGKVEYAAGYSLEGDVVTPNEKLIDEAVEKAKKCGKALIFAGIPDMVEAEGYDRVDMKLPPAHEVLIERVSKEVPETVVVLMIGSPVELDWLDGVQGLLCAYLGGGSAGRAVTGILYGDVNPSGKLAETFPEKYEHAPAFLNYAGDEDDVVYAEGVFVGYRYYQKKKIKVNFPFGYGLSYTKFSYDEIKVDGDRVSVKITNTGSLKGKEVVQLYVGAEKPFVARPIKELKGFKKLELAPMESCWVDFELDDRSFAYYDVRVNDWRVETGRYNIYVGGSSEDTPLTAVIEKVDRSPYRQPLSINTPIIDLLTNDFYAPVKDELIMHLIPRQFLDSIEKHGVSLKAPILERRKYYTLRMLVNDNLGRVDDAMVEESVEAANRKLFKE